jgi:aminoacylase
VGIAMDEGLASSQDSYNIYFQERSSWKLIIKATGTPGHGSKMYDNSAFQNLITSLQTIYSFRESQIELLRSAARLEGEIISINNVYLKAGTPTPTVCYSLVLPITSKLLF